MSQFAITPYLQQTETQARQILPQSVSSTFPLCSMQAPVSPFQPIISFCKSKTSTIEEATDVIIVEGQIEKSIELGTKDYQRRGTYILIISSVGLIQTFVNIGKRE